MDFHFVYIPPCLIRFPVARISKAPWRKGRNIDTNMEISVLHGQPPLLTTRISTNHRNNIFVHLVVWLFQPFQTLANQLLPNYHINMTPSNILSSDSFLSQHRSLILQHCIAGF